MKSIRIRGIFARGWLGLAGVAWWCAAWAAWAATEETFPVLTIGTHSLTNVTVTTKATNYIFIVHSSGMANINVADLPPDLLTNLGYARVMTKARTNSTSGWTKQVLAKIKLPLVRVMDRRIAQVRRGQLALGSRRVSLTGRAMLPVILGLGLTFYLFSCYCCQLLCRKAGREPGMMIWVPVLQMIPVFRAAEMSGWWLLACFVPGLNLAAQILWSLRIVRVRGKSVWVTIFLLLPLINVLALLYLAFSNGVAPKEDQRVEVMTLETA